jgi:hypothetical protein
VPVRTVQDFLAGRTPREETMQPIERGVTEVARVLVRETSETGGFAFVTGGAITGADQLAYAPPDEIVRALVAWDRARRVHEAWTASLTCPACGREADPLHVCPGPALRVCACGCGEVLPAGVRTDRRYLSDAHRKRAGRRRTQ